jgi:hypothetical protein
MTRAIYASSLRRVINFTMVALAAIGRFKMRRFFSRFFLCLLLLPLICITPPQTAQGQSSGPIFVSPTALYRFRISNTDGGYFYTPSYQQGINAGYSFEGPMQDGTGGIIGIYAVGEGYTPDPAAGLTPLYQWTVVEDGWRVHTYLSTYLSNTLGSNYHFNGIRGYVFPFDVDTHTYNPPGQEPLTVTLGKLSAWYSQPLGYWYGGGKIGSGYTLEPSPDSTYVYQGAICSMPKAVTGTAPFPCQQCDLQQSHFTDVLFYPPAPPPPSSCDSTQAQACFDGGGSWDSNSCSCSYYEPPPDDCPSGRCPPMLQQSQPQ